MSTNNNRRIIPRTTYYLAISALTIALCVIVSVLWPIRTSAQSPITRTRASGAQIRIATRSATTTSDTVSANDCGMMISYSNSSAIAVTLPDPTTLPVGCWVQIQNTGAGTVTATPAASTIDGGANIALTQNQGAFIVTSTTQYLTQRGQGQGSGGGGSTSPGGVNNDIQLNNSGAFGAVHPTSSVGGLTIWNGSAWSVGDLPTGNSGILDCTTTHGQCDINLAALQSSTLNWTGLNTFSKLKIPLATIAAGANHLPTASTVPDQWFYITDANSTCDTTTGGGTTRVLVQSNGTTYVAPNCSSGGGQTLSTADQGSWLIDGPDFNQYTATYTSLTPRFQGVANPYASRKISSMSVWMNPGDTGKHGRMAVMNAGCSLVQQSTSTALDTAGLITFTFSTPAVVTDPYYYVGIMTDSTVVQFRTDDKSGEGGTPIRDGIANAGTTPQIFDRATQGSLSFCSTCGTRTAIALGVNGSIAAYARP